MHSISATGSTDEDLTDDSASVNFDVGPIVNIKPSNSKEVSR